MGYTMPTRAKKYCILCAENKALRIAISTSSVKVKQTFLCEFLKQAINK
jgi:ATP-dependent exoDNAse (exonuclease V) alpha subunit